MVVAEPAQAREILTEILKRMGIEATIEMREETERTLLDIKGPEAGLVIGKKGTTLDALQYILGKIIHKGDAEPPRGKNAIIVDAEGYRMRREASLVELAHRLGEKARRTNRTITVNPMSPHDRRIIHITLDKVPGVTTRSEGEGVFRRLLIIPQPDKV
jgi:spoIIIJ-associated protein